MTRCACTPGTYDNGWMEGRCVECIEKEMQSWMGITERAQRYADDLRREGA